MPFPWETLAELITAVLLLESIVYGCIWLHVAEARIGASYGGIYFILFWRTSCYALIFHFTICCLIKHRPIITPVCFILDHSSGFGGKYGVQKDRVDQSAVGYDHQEKLAAHASQKGSWLISFFELIWVSVSSWSITRIGCFWCSNIIPFSD